MHECAPNRGGGCSFLYMPPQLDHESQPTCIVSGTARELAGSLCDGVCHNAT